jgi:hypothetical protein
MAHTGSGYNSDGQVEKGSYISSPRNNCRLMAAGAEKSCSNDPVDRIKDQNSSAVNSQRVEKDPD